MKKLQRGHILNKGKLYVRPVCAAKMLDVHSGTVANWFNEGKISGILLPSQFGTRKVLFVLKSELTKNLHNFKCVVCKKKFVSKVVRRARDRTFCSETCANSWWNYHAPVRAGVRTKRVV
ncbi:MAG: hypothetical protein WCN95_00820 [bacterium]